MNLFLVASNITIVILWFTCQLVEIPYIFNIVAFVTVLLYSGCHYSLNLRHDQAINRGEVDPNGDDKQKNLCETISKRDAIKFPFLGSVSLILLYLAFKYFDTATVNKIISGYFGLIGCAAVTSVSTNVISLLGGTFTSLRFRKDITIKHFLPFRLAGSSPWDLSIDTSLSDVVSFLGSILFLTFYFLTRHWALNNIIGICFSIKAIESFSLGTYRTGAILLIGLFFYDIFWVFGTDVMVTVAQSLDGPIKLLFPRSLVPNVDTGKIDLSLIGLGDIVIPGFFLSLLLRFDAHNANIPYFPVNIYDSFPKPYFHFTLLGFIIGMISTILIMIKFQAAQPALLYLVPACLGSSLIVSVVRGEIKLLFNYSEEYNNLNDENDANEVTKKDK